jgi:hypothetical protein
MIPYITLTIYLVLNVYLYGIFLHTSKKTRYSDFYLLGYACLFLIVGIFIFVTGYIGQKLENRYYKKIKK